ncbi:MAG TPA: transglutaminase-like domain-containing protein [Bacteroidia bacterium]|nr:transglutaminase-like domain-containing protein [Bacteroidia bacterium]HQF28254.1 transglutaminase-like domain-containing protein [Bacteroidia bacterium]HQK98334.1 transglutaminase-like domain-containing protein [Bacteroidia bacterium]
MDQQLNDNEVKALISLLDDSDKEVYIHIEERLVSLGREVIPLLEDAWSHAFDALLQRRIEHIVHKIQFDTLLEDIKLWIHTGNQDLLAGAILVAKYQYPDLDVEKLEQQVAGIKKEIWLELNENLTALEIVNIFNHIFFTNHNFSGNTANYHAPQNSFVNIVLESKKGNPLALSIVYMSIAQSLGLPIYGVNLPEHFVLAYLGNDDNDLVDMSRVLFYINAFSKGSVFGKSDIDQFIKRLNLEPQSSYYLPCSNRDMILRMIRNLSFSYQKLGDTDKVDELAQMIALFNAHV